MFCYFEEGRRLCLFILVIIFLNIFIDSFRILIFINVLGLFMKIFRRIVVKVDRCSFLFFLR